MVTSNAKKCYGFRKRLFYAALLVFLAFPHFSHGFGFGFGSDGSGKSELEGHGDGRDVQKRRPVQKKYKFRKIERIYMDEADDDADDDGDLDDSGDADASQTIEENAQAKESRYVHATADSSRINEEEEYQFKRARKAHRERDKDKTKKTVVKSDESKSFLRTLTFGLFSGDDLADSDESATSNGIIDWIKWFGEKSAKSKPLPQRAETQVEGWISYFNRWPFNSFFPIGKPQKPIRLPRNGSGSKTHRGSRHGDNDINEAQPMSQKQFESLLYTLPGFVADASRVRDIECKQQLQIFQRQLRGNKLWTLQMLDATAKISSGLLRGNINQFGDFNLCTQVKTKVKVASDISIHMRGKYCLAHIEAQADDDLKIPMHLAHGRGLWNSHLGNPSHFVPRYTVANWGICLPQMCSAEVVQHMVESNLHPYNVTGVEFHVEVDEDDCYIHSSKSFMKLIRKDGKFFGAVMFLLTLLLIMVSTVGYEYWNTIRAHIVNVFERFKRKPTEETEAQGEEQANEELETEPKENEPTEDGNEDETIITDESATTSTETVPTRSLLKEIAMSFSPQKTFSVLIAQDGLDMEFPIFHILKLGATFMLYICLKYIMLGHLPITNREQLVLAVDQPFSVVYRVPLFYTDILLLINGFLSAYQLSEEMDQKSHIHILKRLTAKIARYLPTLYTVLFIQTWILPHLDSGPLWSNIIGKNAHLCEQHMWRNLFNVQNAIEVEETCSPMTIQLAIEVQLYLLGPLIVWLYYSNADIGFYTYGAIHALSVAARFSRTNREHLSMTLFHGINVSKFYRTANMMFASPISRATPYLLGIGAGILYRTQGGSLEVTTKMLPYGWGLCLLSIFWCFWSQSIGMRSDFIYSSSNAAVYAAWSPLILGLALVWIIFMFPKNVNSILNHLTSSRPVLCLSRIAFPMQLAMFVVVLYNTANVKEPLKYHYTDLINLSEIGAIIVFGLLLAFLIDVPSRNIRNLVIGWIFMERQSDEVSSGAEQSEGEFSDEPSENVTSPTPEPTESIWASDPEEEEKKYISRRRSSTISAEDIGDSATTDKENIEKKPTPVDAEDEEEDEEADITEEEEVKKRPATPEQPQAKEDVPSTYRRRRKPTADD